MPTIAVNFYSVVWENWKGGYNHLLNIPVNVEAQTRDIDENRVM